MNSTPAQELLRHFQAFLEESGLSRISIKNYVSDVRQFLMSSNLTSARLITHKHLQDYLTQIQNTKPTASYKRYLASMRQFVSFLALEYRINLPLLTSPKIDPSPLTTQDLTNQFKTYLQNEKRSHSTIKNYVSDLNHYWTWSANLSPDPSSPHTSPSFPPLIKGRDERVGSIKRAVLGEKGSDKSISAYLNHLKLSHIKSSVAHRREAALNKFVKFTTDSKLIPDPSSQTPLPLTPLPLSLPLSRGGTKGWGLLNEPYSAKRGKPSLYQRYHALPFVPYLHLAILVLFTTALGLFAYDQVIKQAKPELAFPTSLTRPTRQLSFQGRLTDSSDTPIVTATNLSFKLYSALTGGSSLYSSGTCSVSPDTDGIFNTVIGNGTCGAEIGSSIFSENASLYLEVLVGAQTLTPRQPIATVGYALNSETLQGYPASASAVENTIPIMNNDGDIILGASSPTIQSTSDTFAIKGQTMTLSTNTATNGNISLAPDGTGALNAIGGATTGNFLRVTDANLTSGNLISGYVGNDTASGNLLSLSSGASETTKFVVKSSGNVGVGTTSPTAKLHVEGQCVTGDTLLRRRRRKRSKNGEWIEDWEDVRIDEIEAGDEILTLDEKTGKFVTQKIKGLMDMGIQETYLLITESGKQIRTTAQHPYFVKDTKKSPLGDFQDPANSSSGLTPKESIAGNSQLSNGVWTAGESSPSGLGVNPDLEPFAAHTTDIVTKNAQWKKVAQLKTGMQIATLNGWETIIVLKKYSREQVYDIEVENTHNFIGNGIVAHNTYLKGLDQLNTSFSLRTADSTGADKFVITNAGNVGIGNTSPASLLDVAGTAWLRGVAGGTSGLYVNASGNVGVGTTAPLSKLGILGNASVGATYGSIAAPTSGMIIEGNVGIGTTSPGAKLEIAGGGLLLPNDYAAAWKDTGGTSRNGFYLTSSNKWSIGDLTYDLYFGGPTPNMVLKTSGNVGIGTTGPTSKLQVAGNTFLGSDSIPVQWGSAAGTAWGYLNYNGSTATTVYAATGKQLALGANGSSNPSHLVIATDGNVGIGTTGPAAALHIVNSDANTTLTNFTAGIRVQNTSNTANNFAGLGLFAQQGSIAGFVGTKFSGTNNIDTDMLFYTRNQGTFQEQVRIDKSGNVGIGTTAPTAKLHVVGNCVTGDTLLPIKRRKKRSRNKFGMTGGGDGKGDDSVDDFDEILCPIRDIQPGDEVLSLNESTEALEYSRINKLMDMGIKEVYELTTKSGRTIRTTAEHPFLTLIDPSTPATAGRSVGMTNTKYI